MNVLKVRKSKHRAACLSVWGASRSRWWSCPCWRWGLCRIGTPWWRCPSCPWQSRLSQATQYSHPQKCHRSHSAAEQDLTCREQFVDRAICITTVRKLSWMMLNAHAHISYSAQCGRGSCYGSKHFRYFEHFTHSNDKMRLICSRAFPPWRPLSATKHINSNYSNTSHTTYTHTHTHTPHTTAHTLTLHPHPHPPSSMLTIQTST